MTPAELSLAVTAVANAIAADITDDGQLAVLSSVFGQISAVLAVIASQRAVNPVNGESRDNPVIL